MACSDGDGGIPAGHTDAGGVMADAALSNLLGIPIDYFVGLDFTAFQQAVNAVGGINIDVPVGFTDNQYPACAAATCPYETIHFNAGEQHMNGAAALEYARSRHGNNGQGSDFARSARQQQIVDALKQQVLSIGGIGDLPSLLQALGNNVDTNMTIDDAEAIYDLVEGVNSASILHVSLDDSNFLYECGYPTNCGADYLFAHNSGYAPHRPVHPERLRPVRGAERGSHGGDRGRQRRGRWGLHQMGRYLRSVGLDDPGPGPGPDPSGDRGHRPERRQGHCGCRMVRGILWCLRHHGASAQPGGDRHRRWGARPAGSGRGEQFQP